MPIKNLTDQKAAFPRLGILRKGAPKPKNGNKPGEDLTYFRFVSEDPDAVRAFYDAYGAEPRRINVYLPFASKDENLETWMEEWGAGSLKHRCDGEICVLWQDDSGLYHTEPKPCPGNCKATGRLMVIVPELKRLAYVQVLTTSQWDCIELAANLAAAEDAVRHMERDLRGIPFVLSRTPRLVSTPPRDGGGKRIRAEKWLLHLEPAPSWVALQIEAARRMALPRLEAGTNGDLDITAPDNDDIVEADPAQGGVREGVPGGEAGQAQALPTNGASLVPPAPDFRARLIARLDDLVAEIDTLGDETINLDRAWLDTAPERELIDSGKRLRQQADALKAQTTQAMMPF
jgi:hypothetical protein